MLVLQLVPFVGQVVAALAWIPNAASGPANDADGIPRNGAWVLDATGVHRRRACCEDRNRDHRPQTIVHQSAQPNAADARENQARAQKLRSGTSQSLHKTCS